jgi:hypothetical protein
MCLALKLPNYFDRQPHFVLPLSEEMSKFKTRNVAYVFLKQCLQFLTFKFDYSQQSYNGISYLKPGDAMNCNTVQVLTVADIVANLFTR